MKRKIRFVQQKHELGCAVASIAMVLDREYDEIDLLFERSFDKQGLKSEQVRSIVCEHGFSVIEKRADGFMNVQRSNERMLKPFADIHIVTAQPYADSKLNHCFVMDAKGKIYDPSRGVNPDPTGYYCVFNVLGFFLEDIAHAKKEATRKVNRTARSKIRRSRNSDTAGHKPR